MSSLSPNTQGNVFLLWGGLSGVVHWSQPSVINCHNASKLTNGLCVKEGPLIYSPPLVDPELIISITAGFHACSFSPANPSISPSHFAQIPWKLQKAVVSFQRVRCRPTLQPHKGTCTIWPRTYCICLWTQGHTRFISYNCTASRSQRRDTTVK